MISDIDEPISEATAVVVEVAFPDTPFGGVQVFGITEDVVQVTFSPVPAPLPEIPAIPETPTPDDVFGTTPLVIGQDYVDVAFPETLASSSWVFIELRTLNVTDVNPLNIWPGIVTNKTAAGFRVQLNGSPDSVNYYLRWVVRPATTSIVEATRYFLLGPDTGVVSVPNGFSAQIPEGSVLSEEPVTILLSDSGAGGLFSPASVVLTNAAPMAGFTYTPSSTGLKVISSTNDKSLINPDPFNFTSILAPTTGYTFSGPSTGNVGVASTNFTVALLPGSLSGAVIVTPNDAGDGGVFTPSTVSLTEAAPSATFTYTPASSGTKTLACTNNRGLTDPASLSYSSTLPVHLLSGLTSHWELGDTAGATPVLDSVGTNHWGGPSTSNPFAAKIGNGQFFDGVTSNFSQASNASLKPAGSFTFAIWAQCDDVANPHAVFAKGDGGATPWDYILYYTNGSGYQFQVNNTNITPATGVVSNTSWHLLIAWYDSVAGTVNLQMDNGSVLSTASPTHITTNDIFELGCAVSGGSPFWRWNGMLDEMAYWNSRVLTAAERIALWNGGAGLPKSSYPA